MADPSALGKDLAQTPLANVLITALKQKASGELSIRHAQGEDRIYFKAGVPAGTQVMHAFKPLGRLLLELGWITAAQNEESIAAMTLGTRQGEALVAIGALSASKLEEALRLHQVHNLIQIARLAEGKLTFVEAGQPPWAADVPLNALRILREVLAVAESDVVCDSVFAKTGEDSLLVIPPHLFGTTSPFAFDHDEAAVLPLLSAPITLKQFFARSRLPAERARALAAELLVTHFLVPPKDAVPEGAEQLVQKVDDKSRERRRRMLDRAIASVGSGPFGRGRPMPPPPRHPPPSATGPTTHYATGPGAGTDLPPFEEATTGIAPRPSAPHETAEEQTLRRLIEEKARLMVGLDFYGRLGVTSAATKDQVKSGFIAAAKLFHPDHLPPALSDLAQLQREIFGAIKEAYDTLTDDQRARDYKAERAPKPNAGVRARDEEARELANQAEAALRRRDYPSAAEAFHQAYELSPKGDYLACEGWARFSDPARKSDQKRAREILDEAAQKYPDSERVAQYQGILARVEGRVEESSTWLRKALALNPRNMEVANELHLLELRKRK